MANVKGVCDDCNSGRHFNCAEEAWDTRWERVVECRCYENEHVRPSQ